MANRNYRLLNNASRTALRQAKRRGVQITLMTPVTSPGGSTIQLWAFLDADNQTTGLQHGQTDEIELRFIVPRRQTNFPTEISPGAIVTYDNTQYEVRRAIPDAEDLAHCATVALICGRFGEGNPEFA